MRSVFNRDIARSITSTLGRFLAIAGIVALGCGFYAGLRMTAPDMRIAGDRFYDGTHLYDIRLLSSLGYTGSQLDIVRGIEGVEDACASKSTDVMALLNGEQYAMRVASFDARAAAASSCVDGVNVSSGDGEYLNRLVLAEGSWPTKAGECVLSADRVMGTPIQVGDKVKVLYGSQDLEGVLAKREFTVTGLAHSSAYVSSITLGSTSLGSGSIHQFVYVTEDSFDDDCPYTEIFVRVQGAADEFSGDEAYQSAVDAVTDRLESASDAIAHDRLSEIKADAQAELDDARAEYEDEKAEAEEKLADAQAELDDAARKLEDARDQIDSGQEEYDSGVAQLQDSRDEAQAQLDAARQQLEESQAQITSGEKQIADGRSELDAREQQYQASLAEWYAGEAQYEENAAQRDQVQQGLEQAEAGRAGLEAQLQALPEDDPTREALLQQIGALDAQIAEMQAAMEQFAQLDAAKAQLDAAKAQLDSGRAELDTGWEQLEAKEAELEQAKTQLDEGWAQYYAQEAEANAQLDSAQQELDDAASELETARQELADGQREYDEGKAEYDEESADAREKLSDAEAELEDAQADIDDLELPDIYVLDRTANYGVESYKADSKRIDNIASVFPFIFFLVAALVALTTMTRMVEEDRVLIGTYKALGYSRARITGKYLVYGATASLAGAALGIAVLSQVLPFVVMKAYAIIYNVPALPLPIPIDVPLALLSAGLGVGITLFATWAAAAATLREQPASLMLPRAPVAGKRIFLQRIKPLWKRMSFSWKVTCRNLFRYKKRFWMTVAGIAGCTALLLTGLGLHDAIWDIIDKQYGPIVGYNVVVEMKDDATSKDVEDVLDYMQQSGSMTEYARAEHINMQVASDSHDTTDIEVTVPMDAGDLRELITYKQRKGQIPIQLDDQSVILTEKMATTLGVKPGDAITVYEQDEIGNPKGKGYELQVTDVMEYYVGHALFVGKDAWESSVGTDLEYRAVYGICTEDPDERSAFTDNLHERDEVETVTYNDETIDSYRKMLSSVNMIVVVLVVAAAGLAFIVLYNLTNINITERRREIASLKVLGFTRREVNAYIFRETILLTLIGAALGLMLGYFMEGFVVVTAEVDYVMFGRDIHLASYVIGYLLTIAFSGLVMFAMRGKLGNIDMVESLKSVD